MTKPRDIDAKIVRALLDYSPETGELRWKERGVEWFPGTVGRKRQNSITANMAVHPERNKHHG